MDGFEETINMMVQIQEDNTVPKSIRAVITTTVQQLRSCNEDQALQRVHNTKTHLRRAHVP